MKYTILGNRTCDVREKNDMIQVRAGGGMKSLQDIIKVSCESELYSQVKWSVDRMIFLSCSRSSEYLSAGDKYVQERFSSYVAKFLDNLLRVVKQENLRTSS